MKKFLSLLILPLVAVMIFSGCRDNKSIADVEAAYDSMITEYVEGENNLFFNHESNTKAISIYYPNGELKDSILEEEPSTDMQKRFRAIYYQQTILDYIYDYYNDYSQDFYLRTKNKDLDKDTINGLYDSVKAINSQLDEFKPYYNSFVSVAISPSDTMEFHLTSYSYHLNKLIDKSFNMIHRFRDIYLDCLGDDYNKYNSNNLKCYVDTAYLDMAYIIYLENIKAFNYSVGDNGLCDLSDVVASDSKYNLLDLLGEKGTIAQIITSNIGTDTIVGKEVTERVELFIYTRNVFNQRLANYINNYNNEDIYEISQYRFDLVGGVSYEGYLTGLSSSKRATITILDEFVLDTFVNYINKLNNIIEYVE